MYIIFIINPKIYFFMKKLFLSIVMCALCSIVAMAENDTTGLWQDKDLKAGEFPTRVIRGIEIDPMCGLSAGDRFYQIPELGVQMIWDSQLKFLYVLQNNYYKATKISLNQKSENKGMTITNILNVFMMGDLGRTNLCLGRIVETNEEYWLSVTTYENEMHIRIYENISDEVIFEEIIAD